MVYAPHHRRYRGRASPQRGSRKAADHFCLIVRKHDETRGSLYVRKDFTFLPEKMKFTEFFSGKGKPQSG